MIEIRDSNYFTERYPFDEIIFKILGFSKKLVEAFPLLKKGLSSMSNDL